jgi:hypothetical protein
VVKIRHANALNYCRKKSQRAQELNWPFPPKKAFILQCFDFLKKICPEKTVKISTFYPFNCHNQLSARRLQMSCFCSSHQNDGLLSAL